MNSIRATLEPNADGTLHLPLPTELRQGKLKVVATVELAEPAAKEATTLSSGDRVPDLHPDAMQPGPDFDDPLPDEFWQGEA
jgi:hypothetical protein